jgi:branched-chain amino acid transport system substrate-binding protein
VLAGLMLPASGTFAALGTAIENGVKLYIAENGGRRASHAYSCRSCRTMDS